MWRKNEHFCRLPRRLRPTGSWKSGESDPWQEPPLLRTALSLLPCQKGDDQASNAYPCPVNDSSCSVGSHYVITCPNTRFGEDS